MASFAENEIEQIGEALASKVLAGLEPTLEALAEKITANVTAALGAKVEALIDAKLA